ncbi:MAG: peptidylprolyl isomerase [Planctomycetota bacterium]
MPRTAGSFRLAVNGEEVPPAAVDRATIYFLGRPYLERKIRDFLVADEIERRRREGRPVDDLRIDPEEARTEADRMKRGLEERWTKAGVRDRSVALRREGLDEASLLEEAGSQLLFDKVFIPEDSTEWPESTVEALAGEGGEAWLYMVGLGARFEKALRPDDPPKRAKAQIQALASQGGQDFVDKTMKGLREHREKNPTESMPAFYRTIFRQWITKALKESSRIRTASYGLPADVAVSVYDRPLPTAEAYPNVARMVTAVDRDRVLRWMAWSTATRQALVAAGVYLPEEEFAKEWQAHVGPYEKTPFSIEVVATAFKKFPSYDLYREYFRLRKSFEKMIEKEVTDEALLQHRARVQDFLGDGKVDAQVILRSALDYTDFTWKGPDAFDKAKASAQEVVAALKAGTSFEDAIDRYSEFFDPPAPAAGQQAPQGPRPNRGRFGPQAKNQLKTLLGESEFDELVRGYSVAEILFHEAPIGEAIGPIRGPLGYYVGRVLARHPGAKAIDLAQENSRNLLREDYLARRFLEWSNAVVAKAKIEVD